MTHLHLVIPQPEPGEWIGRLDVVEALEADGWTGNDDSTVLKKNGATWALVNDADDSGLDCPNGTVIEFLGSTPTVVIVAACLAAAIWERQNPGRRWADCEYRWRADAEADADAVLAVLSAPTDQTASTAPLAAGLPHVQGNCPACGHASLFLGSGGYVTCSIAECREPDAATTVLEQYANEAHQPEHTWAAELYDPVADEWVPGTRYIARDRAVNHLNHANAIGPTWKDGTPTQRRLVRATTTYTVEQPAAVARSGQPETDNEAQQDGAQP